MKIVYFFGAGASACADMPTTEEMLEFLKEKPKFAILHRFIKFKDMEHVYTYLENLENPLFTLFMTCDSVNNGTELNDELRKDFSKLREWRKDFMDDIENYLVYRLDPKPHTIKYYSDLLEKLQEIDPNHKLNVITTNYDLLLDKSFNDNCIDGFVLESEGAITKRWKNKWDYDTSKHILVKLHGSINWEYSEGSRKYKERYIVKHQKAIKNPMIIPLTLKNKNYHAKPYREMLDQFKQIVADADLLVVVGYTFRDQEIRDIIHEHLEKNLYVLLLSPNADKTIFEQFKKTTELKISETDCNVYCDTINDSQIYYCNKKFNDDTIHDVMKLIRRMSKMIDTNEIIPSDPNI